MIDKTKIIILMSILLIKDDGDIIMRVTNEGHVIIPFHIREKLGITSASEVEFLEESGRFYLAKKEDATLEDNIFRQARGIATIKMSSDEIMALTRGPE